MGEQFFRSAYYPIECLHTKISVGKDIFVNMGLDGRYFLQIDESLAGDRSGKTELICQILSAYPEFGGPPLLEDHPPNLLVHNWREYVEMGIKIASQVYVVSIATSPSLC